MNYYVFKSAIEGRIVCFVGPCNTVTNDEDKLKPDTRIFLSSVYAIHSISKAEAESYAEFEVAPLIPPKELGCISMLFGYHPYISYNNLE